MCEEDFTMKKYRVNVNGTVYEVELEEITGAAHAASVAAPVAAPAPAAAPSVSVTKGAAVESGALLCTIG